MYLTNIPNGILVRYITNTVQKVPYDIWAQYVDFLKVKVKDVSQHENLKK